MWYGSPFSVLVTVWCCPHFMALVGCFFPNSFDTVLHSQYRLTYYRLLSSAMVMFSLDFWSNLILDFKLISCYFQGWQILQCCKPFRLQVLGNVWSWTREMLAALVRKTFKKLINSWVNSRPWGNPPWTTWRRCALYEYVLWCPHHVLPYSLVPWMFTSQPFLHLIHNTVTIFLWVQCANVAT